MSLLLKVDVRPQETAVSPGLYAVSLSPLWRDVCGVSDSFGGGKGASSLALFKGEM